MRTDRPARGPVFSANPSISSEARLRCYRSACDAGTAYNRNRPHAFHQAIGLPAQPAAFELRIASRLPGVCLVRLLGLGSKPKHIFGLWPLSHVQVQICARHILVAGPPSSLSAGVWNAIAPISVPLTGPAQRGFFLQEFSGVAAIGSRPRSAL
jgi:hypothetical protein